MKAIRRQPKRKLCFGFLPLFPPSPLSSGTTIFPNQRYITPHRDPFFALLNSYACTARCGAAPVTRARDRRYPRNATKTRGKYPASSRFRFCCLFSMHADCAASAKFLLRRIFAEMGQYSVDFSFQTIVSSTFQSPPFLSITRNSAKREFTIRVFHAHEYSRGVVEQLLLIFAPGESQRFTSAIRSRAVGEHVIFIRRYYQRHGYNARTSAAFSYICEQ